MDITRGSLDEISRPASSSRINHGSRVLSASLEILTPELDSPKGDYCLEIYNNLTEDNTKENNDGNGKEYGTKKMRTSEEIVERKTNCSFQLQIQNTNKVKEYVVRSVDSKDDCAEDRPSDCSIVPWDKLTKLQTGSSTKVEDSKEREEDPLLQKAIKKMKRLDEILANKQSQERAIKKKGREMRTKLWEDFQSMTSQSSSVTTEEVENTSRFLALTSSLQETPGPIEEDEMFISVFHTQIQPESYECGGKLTKQDCLNEDRTRSSVKKIENMCPRSETSYKKPPDFIKKNIELAKDSGNQIVMLEEEKKRLSELLKDTEDESSELQVIEEEAIGWLVPGEGYTPEPMEYYHLTEINAKLEIVISDGDVSAVQSSCSKVHKQIYQESLAYANRNLETVPGEKVLRDTKEERDQQNRLREIDQQLKNLEGTPEGLPCLSEEQLNALLEECMQSQRTVNRLALPKSQGSLFDGMSPCCDTSGHTILDSRNEPADGAHSVGMLTSQEMVGAEDEDIYSKEMMEIPDSALSKTLVESQPSEKSMTEKKENDNPEGQEEIARTSSAEDYFMSRAISRDRPKKPSFLDEPFYCISVNNELSTDADIPSIPLKTRGD
ncbi:fibrous sheath-interacting protein 1 isoform X2 [Hemicordylus capensis]|uniref:fibrous sheath-interacting protein 1 isoform X2 n=1 Tax=Hemicordylus capensis TaxID=884348 RepID=UPI002303D601|nr:fibrous sheath-interacting protein 1 isoform X2 [Hemicordylus capensis]